MTLSLFRATGMSRGQRETCFNARLCLRGSLGGKRAEHRALRGPRPSRVSPVRDSSASSWSNGYNLETVPALCVKQDAAFKRLFKNRTFATKV